nr:L [Cambodia Anopheles rhabdovirus] [Cambodia Anopheles rhabdovirus]
MANLTNFDDLFEDYNLMLENEDLFNMDGGFDQDELAEGLNLEEGAPQRRPHMRHLSNDDYNLNSPLIRDNVEGFRSLYINGDCLPIFKRKGWGDFVEEFKRHGVPRENLKGSDNFHTWFVGLTRIRFDLTEIERLITATDTDSQDTFEIPRAFFKGWLDVDLHFVNRKGTRAETKQYGAIFLIFYYITLALNCATDEEMSNIKKLLGCEANKIGDDDYLFIWHQRDLGRIICVGGFCWFELHSQLMDRNMCLMIKDSYGGRFQTMMHIQYKQYPEYDEGHWNSLSDLFQAGDKMLLRYGSKAYSGIKMLEPLVMGRLQQIVESFRPLVPKFKKFQEHLDRETDTISWEMPEMLEFRDIISSTCNIDCLLSMYGSFRLWGHPFINYQEGLQAMHDNTTRETVIDTSYASLLASDFALMVLNNKYHKEKKWYVDINQLPPDHYLFEFVQNNTWPSVEQIAAMPDEWHLLPLMKCYEIPDMIDPTTIYSDKSHSMDLDEIIDFMQTTNQQRPIRTKSVLKSQMERQATDIKKFLQMINDQGLSKNDLVIGLRAKERELKPKGRFFALMSWLLREYFVITEYLIKSNFVPLCKGLTMADDYNTVVNKMIQASSGQNTKDYDEVTIANHVDYEKWNNYQRGEANDPVFRVMGQFHGLPNLFTRTHEFFRESFFYYKDRPDLMEIDGDQIRNAPGEFVCWQGQAGGCEGLRQKGWSLVNYLALMRASKTRNTRIRYLMQGDNQVICSFFATRSSRDETEMRSYLEEIYRNNNAIMESIQEGTRKLGLNFNNDETLQSSQLMVYGKVILINGSITGLPEKRMSRCLCTTNDQLPSIGSVSGTVVTNALTIGNYSETPLNAIVQYNWIGNFARILLEKHNPAIRGPLPEWKTKVGEIKYDLRYKCRYLYLDPSLGGVSGVSIPRFLIRQFPDQVTEGLSSWLLIYKYTRKPDIKAIALEAGHPRLANYDSSHFAKLIENPGGLNLSTGFAVQSVIKKNIREALRTGAIEINNRVLSESLSIGLDKDEAFLAYLESIHPCFPRFISEFYNSGFVGILNGFTGMFENSRTIRSLLVQHLGLELDEKVILSERASIAQLAYVKRNPDNFELWRCSSSHADLLREQSWNRKIVGATVPHPIELLGPISLASRDCCSCQDEAPRTDRITVVLGYKFPAVYSGRGPYRPYLGSKTSETTSLIQPWERITNVPIIRRACNLRRVINWFVDQHSNVAESILQNIKSLTGEDPGQLTRGFKRTGSGLHRFACSRQSNGGFSAVAPNLASHMVMTSDTLVELGKSNYDFMYQSLLLATQVGVVTKHMFSDRGETYHAHVSCLSCIREIEEPSLTTEEQYDFPDMSYLLKTWIPDGLDWYREKPTLKLVTGDWIRLNNAEKSRQVGSILSYYFSDKIATSVDQLMDLFPVVLKRKFEPVPFLEGICLGLSRAAAMQLLRRPSVYRGSGYKAALYGSMHQLTQGLCSHPSFLALCSDDYLTDLISNSAHKVPASYPLSLPELGSILSAYIRTLYKTLDQTGKFQDLLKSDLWIFSEFLDCEIAGPYILSTKVLSTLLRRSLRPGNIEFLKAANRDETLLRSRETSEDLMLKILERNSVYLCNEEVRHACKSMVPPVRFTTSRRFPHFIEAYSSVIRKIELDSTRDPTVPIKQLNPPDDIRNPTIASLRIPQIATGSFLKLGGFISSENIVWKDFLCGGDGSGGMTACLARRNPSSRYIFNSLFQGEENQSRGVTPSPPSAIAHMPETVSSRCVNFNDCWQNPSDLSLPETWSYFESLVHQHSLYLDLMLFDMQVISDDMITQIENNLLNFIGRLLRPIGTLIYKTYLGRLIRTNGVFVEALGALFGKIIMSQSGIGGSHTSEVYLICKDKFPSICLGEKINWSSAIRWIKRSYCYRTVEEEFIRALRLFNHDTLEDIPDVYLPTIENEGEDILHQLGLDPTMRNLILKQNIGILMRGKVEDILFFYLQVGQVAIPTRSFGNSSNLIPSDVRLLKYFAFEIGVHIWISLKMKNLWLYQRLHDGLQNKLSFYYRIEPSVDPTQHFLIWSHKEFNGRSKVLRLDSMHGLISRILRWLTRLSIGRQSSFDLDEVYRRVVNNTKRTFNWGLILRSGALELLGDREVNLDGEVNAFLRLDDGEMIS